MLNRVISHRPVLPASPARSRSSNVEERPGRGRASDQPEGISSIFGRAWHCPSGRAMPPMAGGQLFSGEESQAACNLIDRRHNQ